jgi:hypothetical protein
MPRPHNDDCSQALRLIQHMLDQRWTRPIPPALRRHLDQCPACAAWTSLFHHEPYPIPDRPPSGFADRVLAAARPRRQSRRRLVYASALAVAAALLFAVYLRLPGHTSAPGPQPQSPAASLPELLSSVRKEVEQFPDYVRQVKPPSISLLTSLPAFEINAGDDPFAGSLPPLKSLGASLQGAAQPIELPARAAYQKVKQIIDDPQVRKWVESVRSNGG